MSDLKYTVEVTGLRTLSNLKKFRPTAQHPQCRSEVGEVTRRDAQNPCRDEGAIFDHR